MRDDDLKAENVRLREALEWWLTLHGEDQNDVAVLRRAARSYHRRGHGRGMKQVVEDHLDAIATDLEATRDVFREALGAAKPTVEEVPTIESDWP